MHLPYPPDSPSWDSAAAAAAALHEAGRRLRGRNLGLQAWREIVEGLIQLRKASPQRAARLLDQLATATHRPDVSRLLDQVRRSRKKPKRRRGMGRGPRGPVEYLEEATTLPTPLEEHDAAALRLLQHLDPTFGRPHLPAPKYKNIANLKYRPWSPVGPIVAGQVRRMVEAAAEARSTSLGAIGHRYLEYVATAGEHGGAFLLLRHAAGTGLQEELALLGLDRPRDQPITHPPTVAVLEVLRTGHGITLPLTVDWDAIVEALVERLRVHPGKEAALVSAAAQAVIYRGSPAARQALLSRLPTLHSGWMPLALLASPALTSHIERRRGISDPADPMLADPVRWEPEAHLLADTSAKHRRERELVAWGATHSRLVAHCLAETVAELSAQEGAWYQARGPQLTETGHRLLALLASGGGTMAPVDWPSFEVVTKPRHRASADREDCEAIWTKTQELGRLGMLLWNADPTVVAFRLVERATAGGRLRLGRDVVTAVEQRLVDHCVGYRALRSQEPSNTLRRHLSPSDVQAAMARQPHGIRHLLRPTLEGLAHALLCWVQHPPPPLPRHPEIKESIITLLREAALVSALVVENERAWGDRPYAPFLEPQLYFGHVGAELLGGRPEVVGYGEAKALARALSRVVLEGPRLLQAALGVHPTQQLPLLLGGHRLPIEREIGRLLARFGYGGSAAPSEPGQTLTLKPMQRVEALHRSGITDDCASRTIPFRAVVPGHAYYAIRNAEGQPVGYVSMGEAMAVNDRASTAVPVLYVDSINIRDEELHGNELDILAILQALARQRGLDLALSLDQSTWNFRNMYWLKGVRAFQEGRDTCLLPADPVMWVVYHGLSREGDTYTPLRNPIGLWVGLPSRDTRVLRELDPEKDGVSAFARSVVEGLRGQASQPLRVTVRYARGRPAGFVSRWPGEGGA